jgi:hypothetical protein
MPVDYSLVA